MKRTCLITIFFLLACYPAFAQMSNKTAGTSQDGQFNPFVAAGNEGGFYLAYVERHAGASNVMLRHSIDGKAFSAAVRVNERDGDATVRNENPPKVIPGPGKDVYVCWANERERWKGNIRFARSTDGGRTFLPSITINSDGAAGPTGHAFQSIAIDKENRIYIAWIDERNKRKQDRGAEIWLAVSTARGKTFSHDRRILGDVCECCRISIQADSSGRLFISYRHVPATGPMYRDIFVAASDDGGRTFRSNRVSADGWEINGCPVNGPSLAVDGSGVLTVVWFTGGGEKPGLYYATSANHGLNFTTRGLLDPVENAGRHAQAAAVADGRVLVAWDEAKDQPAIVTAILDVESRFLRDENTGDKGSYPVIAVNGNVALTAAMAAGSAEITLRTAALRASNGERRLSSPKMPLKKGKLHGKTESLPRGERSINEKCR